MLSPTRGARTLPRELTSTRGPAGSCHHLRHRLWRRQTAGAPETSRSRKTAYLPAAQEASSVTTHFQVAQEAPPTQALRIMAQRAPIMGALSLAA